MSAGKYLPLMCTASFYFALTAAKGTEMGAYYFKDPRYQNKIPPSGEMQIAPNRHISEYICGSFCQMFPNCLAFTVYNGRCVGYDTLFTDQSYSTSKAREGVQYYEVSGVLQNIAFEKPTGESSSYPHYGTLLSGQLTVSGGRGGLKGVVHIPCYHSRLYGDKYMWVDLQQKVFITLIKITNRITCCWERFQSISVSIGDTLENLQQCWFFKGPPKSGYVFVFSCGKVGRFVKVQKYANNYLHFCGLEVSGYPVQ